MSKLVFWNNTSAYPDWREAYLVDGVYRACPSAEGWTLEQLNASGDVFELMPFEDAYQRYCDSCCQPVAEITAERFNDMLEVLPPLDWNFNESGGAQSFKLMEMYCGNITSIFAQYGDRFFELRDRVTLAHRDIIARVRAFLAAQTSAA
ncbi:hypothetical protein [Salmonella enterica]|uniref:hypothetical protein n=1 Tax=Salmonella enterica TaxID=28901 RepID=UPI001601DAC4|nr:hypothetical protein [Salmonella enterica]